jgi:hypothetical protein
MPPATRYAITVPVTLAAGQVVRFLPNTPDTCTFDTHDAARKALENVYDALIAMGEPHSAMAMQITPYNVMLTGSDGQHLPMLLPANHIRFSSVG